MVSVFVLLVSAAAGLWAFRNWPQGLRAIVVLLVFEGAVRKWVVPGAADLVYFAKDFLLLGVYAGFLLRRPKVPLRPAVPPFVAGALVVSAAIGLLQVFNPNLPTFLVGLLGFKSYFFYAPLLWVVPAAFADDRAVYSFLRRYVYLAVPVAVLAAMQFASPATSWINAYAPQGGNQAAVAGAVATFGSAGVVRVTGTFSYISGFTTFLLVASLVALSVLAMVRWRLRGNLWVYLSLAAVLASIFMTGSRGPLVLLAVLFPFYYLMGIAREGGLPATGRLLLGVAVLLALVNAVAADAAGAFWERARTAGDSVVGRIFEPFVTPFRIAGDVGIVGLGIGATHQAAPGLAKGVAPATWLRGQLHEAEPTRIMAEIGFVGWSLVFLVRIGLVGMALGGAFRLRSSYHRLVALTCALVFLPHTMGGVVFNVTGGVYYWFFAGVLMLARRLDRDQAIARWLAARAASVPPALPAGAPQVGPAR